MPPVKEPAVKSPDVIDLLKGVQAAYDDVQAKDAARGKAAVALGAATDAHKQASDHLADLQSQLNSILGKVLPAADGRIRQG